MRFSTLASIFGQVKAQGAQLLPAFAQGGEPFLGRGELALCLPDQRLPQRAEPLPQQARCHCAAIDRRHALQPGARLLQGKLRRSVLSASQPPQMRHHELLRPLPQPGRKGPRPQRQSMPKQIQHTRSRAACKGPLQPGKSPCRHHPQPSTGQTQRKCRLLCDAASLAQPQGFVKELTIDE